MKQESPPPFPTCRARSEVGEDVNAASIIFKLNPLASILCRSFDLNYEHRFKWGGKLCCAAWLFAF